MEKAFLRSQLFVVVVLCARTAQIPAHWANLSAVNLVWIIHLILSVKCLKYLENRLQSNTYLK